MEKKQEQKQKAKISLSDIEITEIDGSKNKVDFSQRIANEMYATGRTLSVVIAAQELYKTGECDKFPESTEAIKQIVQDWGYVLRTAIEQRLS